MRNTSFAVTFPVTIDFLNRKWDLVCTASIKSWDCEPVVLWLESKGDSPWVPAEVWEAVEDELATFGPARAPFDCAMSKANVPFLSEAAE